MVREDAGGHRHTARVGRRIRRLAPLLAAGYGATWAVNRSLRRVEGDSMLPLLWPDDLVVTVPVPDGGPRRGDIVVADTPTGVVLKRVIGLPGEDVYLDEDHVHVDGVWYAEPYAAATEEDQRWRPADGYVLLGDNRVRSTDARDYGRVPASALGRVVIARVRPPRWLRGDGPEPLDGLWRRPTVRVVVLSPAGRTLLFRVRDVDGSDATWWETPGGGIKRGETVMEAAARELAEELGHTGTKIVSLGRTDERAASRRGADFVKVEALTATRLDDETVDDRGWTPSEQRNTLEVRWFAPDELTDLDEPTFPGDLTELVRQAATLLPPPREGHRRRPSSNSSGSSSATPESS